MSANRRGISRLPALGAAAVLVACAASSQAGPTGASQNVNVELLAESAWVQPGTPFWVGVHLKMAPKWHTYWSNPGDAGLPTRMRWALPEGFQGGPFLWPYPETISAPPLMSYGYSHEVTLLARIDPPAELATGGTVRVGGRLDWLECEDVCLPGKAQLDLELPVRAGTAPRNAAVAKLFDASRARLPGDGAAWATEMHTTPDRLAVSFQPPSGRPHKAYFFPEQKKVLAYAAPQQLLKTATGYRVEASLDEQAKLPERVAGVLVLEDHFGQTTAVRLEGAAQAIQSAALAPGTPVVAEVAPATAAGGLLGTGLALLAAFAGGLILNLMPCVLPVLSLKVFSFVRHAGADPKGAWRHGLAFAAGVLVCFWALAGALLLLRAGGEQIGWGFQLQSPSFVVFLTCLFFVIGLNLFGVFEVGLALGSAGGGLQGRDGLASSFSGGALATIVATPCTAPFMGSALGFALAQPPYIAMLVFTFLGLGMAAPYVLLSFAPGLTRFVPKPGPWMETFKQVMGFFMMGTAVVLAWIFGRQTNLDAVTGLLAALVIIGLAAWTYGKGTAPEAGVRARRVALPLAALFLASGLFVGFQQAKAQPAGLAGASQESDGIAWEPFSPQRVAELRAAGTPVFIDFTAAWCLSCQVNERVALETPAVRQRFRELGIVALKADWTLRDETITRALASYGRRGVPLYVLYGPGAPNARLLPEVLTPGIVLTALDEVHVAAR